MNCKKIETLIFQYSELTEDEKRQVDAHVESCSACKERLDQELHYLRLIRKVAAVPIELNDAHQLTEKIMRAIHKPVRAAWPELLVSMANSFIPRVTLRIASILLVIFFSMEFFNQQIHTGSYSTEYQGGVKLNTQQLLLTRWMSRKVPRPVSFYECVKQDDCRWNKNFKAYNANEKL